MTTYNFPSYRPNSSTWKINRLNQYTGRGLTTGVPLASGSPGGLWSVSASFILNRVEGAALVAFLDRIQGTKNRVSVHNWLHSTPMGQPSGFPVISGAGQTGNSVYTRSWSVSRSGLLLPGDMVGFGGELKRITQSVSSNSSGYATIYFEPSIRVAPGNGVSVDYTNPTAVFYLVNASQATDEAGFYSINIELLEDPA